MRSSAASARARFPCWKNFPRRNLPRRRRGPRRCPSPTPRRRRPGSRQFTRFIGFDRRGRWIFKPQSTATSTLVIDPTLPDVRPRLPVWVYPVKDGKVGWTAQHWPVIDRGGAWVLIDKGWRPLDKATEK